MTVSDHLAIAFGNPTTECTKSESGNGLISPIDFPPTAASSTVIGKTDEAFDKTGASVRPRLTGHLNMLGECRHLSAARRALHRDGGGGLANHPRRSMCQWDDGAIAQAA